MNTQTNFHEQNTPLKVGMFNLKNGQCVEKLDEKTRTQVRSIVALIDEANNYALGMCPVKIMLPFSFGCLPFRSDEIRSGREATNLLLEAAAKHGIELPAAEFCVNFDRNGVSKGEAFLPSYSEVRMMPATTLMEAWHQLGLDTGDRTFVSATVGNNFDVWLQSFSRTMVSGWYNQYRTFGVIPVVEIKF